MGRVISITDTPSTPSRKTQLDDATSAFFFSRLPREERIARTLEYILGEGGEVLQLTPSEWLQFGAAVAPYAIKDFAVRPGKL